MRIYGTYPVLHTSEIFAALEEKSQDPIKPVVCLAWDKRDNAVIGYGVNKVIKPLLGHRGALQTVATDLHPDKKFLMVHAEIDWLLSIGQGPADRMDHIALYTSVQPCMECMKMLLNAGVQHVEWLTDNRHQDEQAIIKKYVGNILYKQNSEGLMLSAPHWIVENGSQKVR